MNIIHYLTVDVIFVLSVGLAQIPGNVYILFTDNVANQIWKLDVSNSNYSNIVIVNHKSPVAIDYDPLTNKIYWTDVNRSDVRTCGFNGESVTLVRALKTGSHPDGLTLDPISRLIFYTDTGNDVIAVMDMTGAYHKTVINTHLDEPRGIALDKKHRVIYWTDWGTKPKIEKATYLGENRETVVSTGLTWPNGITLDVEGEKIFWCDAKTHTIEFINFDGSNRRQLAHGETFHPYGIFLFEQDLYCTDWNSKRIFKIPVDRSNITSWGGKHFSRLNGIHVFRAGAFHNDTNLCTTNKGGCEQICIPTSGGRKCACDDGFKLTTNGLNCAVKCNGSDGFSCNKHFGNSHIVYDNGVVQTDSGGRCVAPNNCTNCNKGFYPGAGYCDMCEAIKNCNLEECTTGSDEICTRCEGVVMEKEGMRAYTVTSDRRQCIQACSWRNDSSRCYPGQCKDEWSSNCVCLSGFTGHHCQTITTRPTLHGRVRLTGSGGEGFTADSADNGTAFWTNLDNPTSVHYNLSAQSSIPSPGQLPVRPAYIEAFRVGIVMASFNFKLSRGSGLLADVSRLCSETSVADPPAQVNTCVRSLTRSDFPSQTLPFHNGDRIQISIATSNGGSVRVRNLESGIRRTFPYIGQTVKTSFTLHIDLNKPYHCGIGTLAPPCSYKMINANDVIKRTDDSRIDINPHGWRDDGSGVNTVDIRITRLRYSAGKLRTASGNTVYHTTAVLGKGQMAGFTLTLKGVYSILLSVRDNAGNERKARRIVLYDPVSTITTNKNHPVVIASAVASINHTWQTDTAAILVVFTDRFINSLQTTNNWLAPVADDSQVGSQYDDHEGEITVDGVPNRRGIVRFKTAYQVNPTGEELTREPEAARFQDQGLNTIVQLHPRLADGDLIAVWVKAYDVKRNMRSERVQVQIDSSPPVIDKLKLDEDTNDDVILHIQVFDRTSGIDRIQWKITDTATGISFALQEKKISPLGVAACSQLTSLPEVKSCYCTLRAGCFSSEFSLTVMQIAEEEPTYAVRVTVWNNAQNSVTIQKKLSPSIQTPAGDITQGEAHSFSWGEAFERLQGVQFYKYAFGPRCYTRDEVAVVSSDIKVTKTTDTSVSWTAPSNGNFYLTVVAFDSASQPIQTRCSVIAVGAGSSTATISIPVIAGAAAAALVLLVVIVVVVVVVKRRKTKNADDYEHLDRSRMTPNTQPVFNIAYGLDDDIRSDTPQQATGSNREDDPYCKLGRADTLPPSHLYDFIGPARGSSSTDAFNLRAETEAD